jgi:hypothetical protein
MPSSTRSAQGRTAATERLERAAIGGFLDHDLVARVHHGVRQQPDRLLGAVGDQDLGGIAGQAVRGVLCGDGLAQAGQPGRVVAVGVKFGAEVEAADRVVDQREPRQRAAGEVDRRRAAGGERGQAAVRRRGGAGQRTRAAQL